MDKPQRLKASRKAYRSHLTRLFKKVDEILEKETPITDVQVVTLTSSLEQLTQKKDIFQQLHTQLAEAMQTADDLENEILEAEEIQNSILDKMSVIKHRLEPRHVSEVTTRPLDVSAPEFRPTSHPVVSDTEPIVTTREPVNHLPKLTLPIFSGDHLAWQTFHDSFKAAVHNNTALNKIQKFNYLRAQLHGDGLRAIAGLPLTDANYDHAMALLTERYVQSHKIVHAHMQALLEINTPTNSLSSLQLFYDTIEAHIRGLAALGKSEDAYGAMLVPIILGKLQVDVRRNLAREHGNSEWTIRELKDAILKEIRVLESGWFTNEGLLESHRTPMTTTLHTNISGQQSAEGGTSKKVCIFCKGPHPPVCCDIVVIPQKRLAIVKRGKHCFNCLGHHKASQCQSKFRCKKCKQKHHSSLCGAEFCKSSEATKTDMKEVPTQTPTTVTAAIIPPEPVIESPTNNVCLLKTAVTQVNAGELQAEANILLDEGAQRSFISDKLAHQLKITPQLTENVSISAFGNKSSSTKQLGVAVVNVETITGQQIPISVLMVPTIAAPLQSISHTHLSNMKHLQGLRLANPLTITNSFEISLLIGADYYWQFVGDHIIHGNGPMAVQSKLGYLLSGPLVLPTLSITSTSALHVSSMQIDQDVNPEFWMMESTGVTQQTAEESDKQFLDNYQRASIRREDDGAYCVKFSWKQEHPPLPSNYTVCKTKIRSLARRLNQTPELLHMYGRIIAEQEQKGFIEKVPKPDLARSVHYIPHHPIKKESSTTPIRIVYNCSCHQFTNPSLNDCLVTGSSFLTDMCSILLRFRLRTFGLSTDLEKAFLHVRLDEADRDYTRF